MIPHKVWVYVARVRSPQKESHTLLQTALERWAQAVGQEGADLTVVRPRYQKPFLKALPQIGFSVSHSGEYWACAISAQRLGLDLQQENFSGTERIARRFFHPEEKAYLGKYPERFFRVWTAKESYVKFTGEGVTDQFGDFSVVEGGALRGELSGAGFRFLPFEGGYALCLCGEEVSDVQIDAL